MAETVNNVSEDELTSQFHNLEPENLPSLTTYLQQYEQQQQEHQQTTTNFISPHQSIDPTKFSVSRNQSISQNNSLNSTINNLPLSVNSQTAVHSPSPACQPTPSGNIAFCDMSRSPSSSKNYSRLSEIDKNKQNCEQKLKISRSGTFLRTRNPVDVLSTDQPTVATVRTPTPFICNSCSLRVTPISGSRQPVHDVTPLFDVTPAHDPRTTPFCVPVSSIPHCPTTQPVRPSPDCDPTCPPVLQSTYDSDFILFDTKRGEYHHFSHSTIQDFISHYSQNAQTQLFESTTQKSNNNLPNTTKITSEFANPTEHPPVSQIELRNHTIYDHQKPQPPVSQIELRNHTIYDPTNQNDNGSDPSFSSSSSSSSSNSDSTSLSSQSRNSRKSKKKSKKKLSKKSHKSKKKEDKKEDKKYTILFNKLCKSATHHNLCHLKLDGDPTQRRRTTAYWLDTVKDVLRTSYKTNHILENYPNLPENIPKTTNRALGSFLRAYMSPSVKNIISGVSHQDGLGILSRLQTMYAPITNKDVNKAIDDLNLLQMHQKDSINNFIGKFRRSVKQLQEVCDPEDIPSEYKLINLFLQKCLQIVPNGSDARQALILYERDMNKVSERDPLPHRFAEIEANLLQYDNINSQTRTPNNRKVHANNTTKKKSYKCLHCGGNHKLFECKQIDITKKKELWAQYKEKQKNKDSKQQLDKNKQANNANTTKETPVTDTGKSQEHSAQTATTQPSNKQVQHWASMAKLATKKSPTVKQTSPNSHMSDWLIDSGCSNHMTPYKSDLIRNIIPSKSIVEVANGNLVQAPIEGTACIRIVDVNDHHQHDILLNNVLYVPGLSRRLFSVSQWTKCGGNLSFNGETCQMQFYTNNNSKPVFKMNLHAPFSARADAQHIVPIASNAKKKIKVSSTLLHNRLGHRSNRALTFASDQQFWSDVTLSPEIDTICQDCDITFSKKAKRGDTDLLANKELCPGSCLMLDIQSNASKFGISKNTNFCYFLQITDTLTRFTVLLGMEKVDSHSVFSCLSHYATYFKPNPKFEVFTNIDQVHADAGSAFTSKEFIQDCESHGIQVSFAAPRHQEMNGICERTWANIRNIAFSFLVHARVGFEFYALALEHAWKVHACLPIKNLTKDGKSISPYEYFYGVKPCIR